MVELAINSSMHASTTHTPFYVNGLHHPRIPALIQSDSGRREELDRAKTVIALAHRVPPHTSIRLMPMSRRSTSKKSILAVAKTLLLHQTVKTMLAYLALSMTVPTRKIIFSLI